MSFRWSITNRLQRQLGHRATTTWRFQVTASSRFWMRWSCAPTPKPIKPMSKLIKPTPKPIKPTIVQQPKVTNTRCAKLMRCAVI